MSKAVPKKPYFLQMNNGRLELTSSLEPKIKIYAEFLRGPQGYRRRHGGGLKQLIARAVGLKNKSDKLKILDATAGLGQDAFVLACLNCEVLLVERSPIIAALLEDGLKRAAEDPQIREKIINNMVVVVDDSRRILETLSAKEAPSIKHPNVDHPSVSHPDVFYPDVVYLDPMFPLEQKHALTKIEMRIIRDIVGSDDDAGTLLLAARKVAKKRVVVKRPLRAEALLGLVPNFVVEGRRNRYDVYLS